MPKIESLIRCEINPIQPIKELCVIISAVSTHQVNAGQEQAILVGLREAIDQRIEQLTQKEVKANAE